MNNLVKLQEDFFKRLEASGKSFNTIKNYKTDLRCFNSFLLEYKKDLNLDEFTTTQAQEYTRFLENKYNSDNSRRRRVQALRIFFDFLVLEGEFPNNPIKKIAVSPKVLEKPNPTPYHIIRRILFHLNENIETSDQMNKLLNLRNKILIYFIYGAGLKVSDIENLKKGNIIKSTGKDEYRVLITHDKKEPFSIPLPKDFNLIFKKYNELLEKQKVKDRIEFEDVLFNANPFKILSGGLSARGCEIIFKELSKTLNYKITPRNLRQSCVFRWLAQDINHISIKEWLGVRPSYSLKPFIILMEEVNVHTFVEIQEKII